MSVLDEFRTVELILNSNAKTSGVDAFCLSVIKLEKQARKLLTYLVYQHQWCNRANVIELREELAKRKNVYFEGFIQGWDALYPCPIKQLVGQNYQQLWPRLMQAEGHRNKIFHGQLTGKGLSRSSLIEYVKDIKGWCEVLGNGAKAEIGYDGYERNSFRKAPNAAQICAKFKIKLVNITSYGKFIKDHMER